MTLPKSRFSAFVVERAPVRELCHVAFVLIRRRRWSVAREYDRFFSSGKKNQGNYVKLPNWLFYSQGKRILYTGKRRLQSRWRVVFAQKGGSCLASQSGFCKESDKTTSAWQIIERQWQKWTVRFASEFSVSLLICKENHFIIIFDWFG